MSDTPLDKALVMPPPSLGGLLKALWRGQRGEDICQTTTTVTLATSLNLFDSQDIGDLIH